MPAASVFWQNTFLNGMADEQEKNVFRRHAENLCTASGMRCILNPVACWKPMYALAMGYLINAVNEVHVCQSSARTRFVIQRIFSCGLQKN